MNHIRRSWKLRTYKKKMYLVLRNRGLLSGVTWRLASFHSVEAWTTDPSKKVLLARCVLPRQLCRGHMNIVTSFNERSFLWFIVSFAVLGSVQGFVVRAYILVLPGDIRPFIVWHIVRDR